MVSSFCQCSFSLMKKFSFTISQPHSIDPGLVGIKKVTSRLDHHMIRSSQEFAISKKRKGSVTMSLVSLAVYRVALGLCYLRWTFIGRFSLCFKCPVKSDLVSIKHFNSNLWGNSSVLLLYTKYPT